MKRAYSLSELSEGAITCRSFGHAWKPYTAERMKGGYNVTLTCDHDCGTLKHFQLSIRGEYGHPHYSYSDNYLAKFTVTSADRMDMRLEALKDYLPKSRIGKQGKIA
jgi:hypothetical protein